MMAIVSADKINFVVFGLVPQISQSLDCNAGNGIVLDSVLRAKILTKGMTEKSKGRCVVVTNEAMVRPS